MVTRSVSGELRPRAVDFENVIGLPPFQVPHDLPDDPVCLLPLGVNALPALEAGIGNRHDYGVANPKLVDSVIEDVVVPMAPVVPEA